MVNYDYDVDGLLRAAGLPRAPCNLPPAGPGKHNDHVVELQLVAAALTRLPNNTYSRPNWQKDLVTFFQEQHNFQVLDASENRQKGQSVRKHITGNPQLTQIDRGWIIHIRRKWDEIKSGLVKFDFANFIKALDSILE